MSCLFIFSQKGLSLINILMTNNPMAAARYANDFTVEFSDHNAIDMLKTTRDKIHMGHKLITHPVTSGTAPNGSPFVSIVISAGTAQTDFDSVIIIENAIVLHQKLAKQINLPKSALEDFMTIDTEMLAKDSKNITNR